MKEIKKSSMSQITVKKISTEIEWESFIQSHSEANFLQSYLWGVFQEHLGKEIERIGFYNQDLLVGVMLAVIEKAKRSTYLTIAGGPILDWHDDALLSAWVSETLRIAKDHRCVFFRVRPQLQDNAFSQALFQKHNFKNSPMHLTADLTHQLNLALSEEELMKNMRKTTRNEIKKAEKIGVKITATTNPQDIDEFYEIQMQTAKFHKFVPFSHKFLQEQFRTFAQAGHALLYKSYYEDKLLALAFVIFYGEEAVYHYGASTHYGREYPGAYLIQWEAIKEAKRRGLSRYNFWGVAPEGQPEHRFHGVSVFKRGFGGEDIHYLPAHDFVINPLKYKLNYLIEILRKKRRKL
jgi:lipid II:glycine glycyltransferase (peptidoglycan interpeptide bridge formation enzyme)